MPKKPVVIPEVHAPLFLSELDLARLNAAYYELELAKSNCQNAQNIVQLADSQLKSQVASVQRSMNIELPGWNPKTGQIYVPAASEPANNSTL